MPSLSAYLGRGLSLHGCSGKAQLLLLTLDMVYLLTAAVPGLGHGEFLSVTLCCIATAPVPLLLDWAAALASLHSHCCPASRFISTIFLDFIYMG